MGKTKEPVEVIITPPSRFALDLEEIIRYKELLFSFIKRDISVKYKQTVLGFLWVVLQPLIMMAIFVVFFSRFLNVPTDDLPAPVFYYSGLIIWTLFSTSMSNASNSMLSNSHVIKKVYFPRIIIPISSIGVALFDYLIATIIYLGIIIYYSISLDSFEFSLMELLIFMPASVIITCVTSFGVGTVLASLIIKFRDFKYIIPFLTQFLMFVTPVIYPVSILDSQPVLKYVFAVNPMFSTLTMARAPFTDNPIDYTMVAISLASMVLIFILGIFVFKKTERYFADIA